MATYLHFFAIAKWLNISLKFAIAGLSSISCFAIWKPFELCGIVTSSGKGLLSKISKFRANCCDESSRNSWRSSGTRGVLSRLDKRMLKYKSLNLGVNYQVIESKSFVVLPGFHDDADGDHTNWATCRRWLATTAGPWYWIGTTRYWRRSWDSATAICSLGHLRATVRGGRHIADRITITSFVPIICHLPGIARQARIAAKSAAFHCHLLKTVQNRSRVIPIPIECRFRHYVVAATFFFYAGFRENTTSTNTPISTCRRVVFSPSV